MIQEVDSKYLEEDTINNPATLVYIWAGWCSVCKDQLPILETIASMVKDNLIMLKVKAEGNQEILVRYKVIGIPTILYFSHGILIDRKVGLQSPETILKQIEIITSLSKEEALSRELRGFFHWPI